LTLATSEVAGLRHALGQSLSAARYKKLDPKIKAYLDSVLATLQPLTSRE
jgi:hypothetical protein